MRKLIVLGVPIDDLTMDAALKRLEAFIAAGRQNGRTHQLATVNADFVVNSLHDPELRRILQQSDMATPDGMPLVWAARLLGMPLEGRVTGADMVPALAELAAQKGYSIFFLGARPGVAAQAAEILAERNPGLKVAGVLSPPPASVLDMDAAIVEEVKAARPDILLVAFGNPKQEKWISMHAPYLQIPVAIGIGGTLDMITGTTRRAPLWMQRTGFEWLYRLAQEPGRLWKRYVKDMFYFGYFFVRQWWQLRGGSKIHAEPLAEPESVTVENNVVLQIKGRMDISNHTVFLNRAMQMIDENPNLIIDMSEAEFLDSTALGALVTIANRTRSLGGDLILVAVPVPIQQLFSIVNLDTFFEMRASLTAALIEQQRRSEAAGQSAEQQGDWHVMQIPRVLDAGNANSIMERSLAILDRHPFLVLDFSETVFLASAGMAALIKIDRQARQQGGSMRVAACLRDVTRSLALVKLDSILSIYDTVAEATSESVTDAVADYSPPSPPAPPMPSATRVS